MPGKDVRHVLSELVEGSDVVEQGVSWVALLDNLAARLKIAAKLALELQERLPAEGGDLSAMTDHDREQASTALGKLTGTLTQVGSTMRDVQSRLDMFLLGEV